MILLLLCLLCQNRAFCDTYLIPKAKEQIVLVYYIYIIPWFFSLSLSPVYVYISLSVCRTVQLLIPTYYLMVIAKSGHVKLKRDAYRPSISNE